MGEVALMAHRDRQVERAEQGGQDALHPHDLGEVRHTLRRFDQRDYAGLAIGLGGEIAPVERQMVARPRAGARTTIAFRLVARGINRRRYIGLPS